MRDIEDFDVGRRYLGKMIIQDMINKSRRTTPDFADLRFGVDLPQEDFTPLRPKRNQSPAGP